MCDTENRVVHSLLWPHVRVARSIIDLGAGTGLFLDLFPEHHDWTTCIDPSVRMLTHLQEKHPGTTTFVGDHSTDVEAADLLVSLFGAPGYVNGDLPAVLRRLVRPHGTAWLMFYAPGHPGAKPLLDKGWDDPALRVSQTEALELGAGWDEVDTFTLNRFTVLVLGGHHWWPAPGRESGRRLWTPPSPG